MKRIKRIAAGLLAASLVFVSFTGQGFAQNDGKRVLELEETKFVVKPQKPEAFYILQHDSLSYEALEVKASFLKDLESTLEDDLF